MKRFKDLIQMISLDQMMRTIPTGLFLIDLEQRIVYWNTEAERMTGYSAAEALGRHCSFMDGIPCTRDCGLYDESVSKPIRGSICSLRSRDGRRLALLKNIDLLRDDQGEIIGGIESFTDISRQAELEEQLRKQAGECERTVRVRTAELEAERTRLRTALDAMGDLAYITTADYKIDFMNRAMIETFGDYRGRRCHEIYGRQEICPLCPLPATLAGETIRQERFIETNGRTYEIMHTPLQEADGTTLKLSVFRDITDRKEAERDLRQAYRELDSFVYTVSHDLRTPLTLIIGFAGFLRDEHRNELDPRAMEILDDIEAQGLRMADLMEDLLVLSRVGRLDTPDMTVETGPVVRQVLADFSSSIDNAALRVDVNELLPVAVPETLLSQVFSNLIANAIRYAGRERGRIEIGSIRGDERIRFYVRDHGPGIPPEERERVFELFHRGSTATGTIGTGIGLATVRKIAESYGGGAWVEETAGGGSTFWVEFADKDSGGSAR